MKQAYNDNRKRQDFKRLCQEISYLYNNRLVRGGYCAFMGNIIIKIINTKSAVSSFFAISTMLTFHKHTPFHRLGISACEYKSAGITAGVNTVEKSCLIGLFRQILLYTVIRCFSRDFVKNNTRCGY